MGVKSVRAGIVIVAAALPWAVFGCGGGGGGTNVVSPVIAKTASSSGDGQTAQVGTLLAAALRVVVTLSGAPQQGTTVSWGTTATGANVNPTTSVTDANGVATTAWTLGSAAGTQNATASLAGATGSPVTFSATATAAPVPVIGMTPASSGNGQTGAVATTLANPLRVLVTLSGAVQQGVTVTWAAQGTAASVAPPTSVTDATGIATTTWTLGHTSGPQSATATLAGATGSPVTFAATATPGAATSLGLSSGNNQTAFVSTAFATALAVLVGDQFGNGVPGDSVSWLVTSGPATILPAKSASGANGLAQATLTAGASAGAVTITATSGTLTGSPVTFNATVATVPTTASVNVGNFFFKSARNNSQNPAVDTIAAGGTVTWNFTGGTHGAQSTGSPSFAGQQTVAQAQSSGTFQVTFATPGTYTYDCVIHGSAMTGRIVVQ